MFGIVVRYESTVEQQCSATHPSIPPRQGGFECIPQRKVAGIDVLQYENFQADRPRTSSKVLTSIIAWAPPAPLDQEEDQYTHDSKGN